MHELSDEQLVAAYLERSDQGAFRTLVERHQDRIYGYLMRMVRDPNMASDLFQETFLKAINAMQERRGSYTQQGRWVAWIMRIARNTALDHLRSRKKWQDVEGTDDEEDRSFWDRLPSDATPADEHLHHEEQVRWLEQCIDQLPPEQREVVLLRQDTDLTFREIAELTEVSINTALGRMRYALNNLRSMMQDSKKKQLAET